MSTKWSQLIKDEVDGVEDGLIKELLIACVVVLCVDGGVLDLEICDMLEIDDGVIVRLFHLVFIFCGFIVPYLPQHYQHIIGFQS